MEWSLTGTRLTWPSVPRLRKNNRLPRELDSLRAPVELRSRTQINEITGLAKPLRLGRPLVLGRMRFNEFGGTPLISAHASLSDTSCRKCQMVTDRRWHWASTAVAMARTLTTRPFLWNSPPPQCAGIPQVRPAGSPAPWEVGTSAWPTVPHSLMAPPVPPRNLPANHRQLLGKLLLSTAGRAGISTRRCWRFRGASARRWRLSSSRRAGCRSSAVRHRSSRERSKPFTHIWSWSRS